MFDSDEADGYNQLGQNLTPASENQAASTVDGLKGLGDKTFHALLGETDLPQWKDVFDVMFSSNADTTQVGHAVGAAQNGLPSLEIVQPNGMPANQGVPNLEIVNNAAEASMQSMAAGNSALGAQGLTADAGGALQIADKLPGAGAGALGPGMDGMGIEALKWLDSPMQMQALNNAMTELFKALLPGPLGIFAAVLQLLMGVVGELLTA